jgi:hypothetical protein
MPEKMKPLLSVVAHINILRLNELDQFVGLSVDRKMGHSTVIATHVLWISVFFCLFATPAFPTSGIALSTHDLIVFAIDGMVTLDNSQGRSELVPTCKIHFINGYVVMMAGTYRYVPTRFNAELEVRKALTQAISVSEALAESEKRIAAPYRLAMQDMKRRHPELSTAYDTFQLVIGRITSGQSQIGYREIPPTGEITRQYSEPGFDDATITTLGLDELIVPYLRKAQWYKENLPMLATRLIKEEARKHPDMVGDIVSVLVMDSIGTRWVNKGACQQ